MRMDKFAWAALLAATLLVYARPAAAQGNITFSLDHLQVSGEAVTFDVLAHVDEAGARLGDTQVYIEYNNSTFGEHIRGDERISATLGDALTGSDQYGAPIVNDNTGTRVSLTAEFLGQADEGVSLSSEPIVLLHVTMQPISDDQTGQIAFYEPLMEGQQYTSDLETTFGDVDADGLLEADLLGLLSPTLTASTPRGGAVRLDWTAPQHALAFEVEHAEGTGDNFRSVAVVEKPIEDDRFLHEVDGLEIGTHRFRVRQTDEAGNATYSKTIEITVEMTEQFLLDPIYPNPFNPQATVRFAVREAEAVRIDLFNALGQRVRSLYDGTPQAGTYQEVRLDGSNLAGGVYFVRLQGESFAATQRVILLK